MKAPNIESKKAERKVLPSILLFFFFLAAPYGMQKVSFLTGYQNPAPPHRYHEVLITGAPGKSVTYNLIQ